MAKQPHFRNSENADPHDRVVEDREDRDADRQGQPDPAHVDAEPAERHRWPQHQDVGRRQPDHGSMDGPTVMEKFKSVPERMRPI